MRRLLTTLALILCGCGQPTENAAEPIAPEANMQLSAQELADLKQIGKSGELQAMNTLVNYYLLNFGEFNEDGIYWELQAARHGDCRLWKDLMFMEIEDGHPVPQRFLFEGETLKTIGTASGCPPYKPRKLS